MNSEMRKDYIWNSLGSFLQSALSPLLLLIVTRLNGIEASGLFSFALAVSLVFWAVGLWGGRTYQVSDVKGEFLQQSYVVVRVILCFVMIFGAIGFGLINQYDTTKWILITVLVIFKACESLADALYGILQRRGRLYLAGMSLTLKAVGSIVLFTGVDIVTENIIAAAVAIVLVNIFFLIVFDLRYIGLATLREARSRLGQMMSESRDIIIRCAPVAVVLILSMFSLNIPRYFVDIYHENEIGYFGIMAMPVTLIGLFVVFILQPNITQLSAAYANNHMQRFKVQIYKIMLSVTAIGSIVLLITALIGVPILGFVFGVDFHAYDTALIILVFGGLMNAIVTILINVLTITRSLGSQFFVLLITNIALAVASYYYVPYYGVMAAVALFAITNTIQSFVLYAIYKIRVAVRRDTDLLG